MLKPRRLAVCLLGATVLWLLVSGCGSTKTASSNNTTSTSAPAQSASQQSTGSTQKQQVRKAHKPKVAEAKPQRKEKSPKKAKPQRKETAAEAEAFETPAEAEAFQRRTREREAREREAARPGLTFAEAQLPRSRRYPKELQGKFMISCKAARGSTSSCECIVAKQELKRNIEVGRGLAELLAVELAFQRGASLADVIRHRVPSPDGVRRVARECRV